MQLECWVVACVQITNIPCEWLGRFFLVFNVDNVASRSIIFIQCFMAYILVSAKRYSSLFYLRCLGS